MKINNKKIKNLNTKILILTPQRRRRKSLMILKN